MNLSSLAHIFPGVAFRKALTADPNGDLCVIVPSDIQGPGAVSSDKLTIISGETVPNLACLRTGDVLFPNRAAAPWAVVFCSKDRKVVAHSTILILRPRDQSIVPEYLAWFLNLQPVRQRLLSSRQGSSVLTVTKEALSDLDIPLPPLAAQQQLAKLGALAEREKSLIQKIEELKFSVLSQRLFERATKDADKQVQTRR